MAVYFAKYGTAGRKDYQHHVPREWLTSVLACDDCGAREHPAGWLNQRPAGLLARPITVSHRRGAFLGHSRRSMLVLC